MRSTLSLLMLGVLANNHYFAFSLNDFAFLANLLYGWFYFHAVLPFLSSRLVLLSTPCDSALCGIVDRHLNGHLVTGQNFDIVHSQLSRYMSRYDMLIGKLDLEGCIGQCLNDYAFKFNYIILSQNNPSLHCLMC